MEDFKTTPFQNAVIARNSWQMHRCLSFCMRLIRFAGFFPVEGLEKRNSTKLKYNVKGFYGVYHLIVVLMKCFGAMYSCFYFFGNNLSIFVTDLFLFHVGGFYSMVILSRISKKWPAIIRKVTQIEHHLQEIRTAKNTDKYCNVMTSIVMTVTWVNYLLWMIYQFHLATKCKATYNDFGEEIEGYFIAISPFYFHFHPYNHIVGVILQIADIQVEFLRSITDALIINFSIYLTSHLRDLNKIINNHQDRMNDLSWEHLRIHYTRVLQLVEEVNATFSLLVCQSFLSYVFKSCLKLAGTLKTNTLECDKDISDVIRQSPMYWAHYTFAFWYHFMRFIVTSLIAANVNLEARKPLMLLTAIQSSNYNLEVQRFRMMIMHSQVSISGALFYVTHPMILQVFGSIITYVVVMVQHS